MGQSIGLGYTISCELTNFQKISRTLTLEMSGLTETVLCSDCGNISSTVMISEKSSSSSKDENLVRALKTK